jgi:hypothetical protein
VSGAETGSTVARELDAELALELYHDRANDEWDVIYTDVGEYGIRVHDWLVSIISYVSDEAIVAKHGIELHELLPELDDEEQLVTWVTLVRETVLKRHAYELNQAAASMGAYDDYIVSGGMVVSERDLLARAPQLVQAPQPVRVVARARGRRRRRASARRPNRSADREPEPDPPSPAAVEAVLA